MLTPISTIAAVTTAALGVLVLIGWALDIIWLKQVLPSFESMKANTALGFVLAGAGLWCNLQARWIRYAGAGFGAVLIAIAVLTLVQDIAGITFGIDELLFKDEAAVAVLGAPGRMSLASSVAFLFSGLALLTLAFVGAIVLAQVFALLALGLALVALTGYLFDVESLYATHLFTSMAMHTAVGFLLINIGVLAARPGMGIVKPLASGTPGLLLIQRLAPFTIAAPLASGAILVSAEHAASLNATFAITLASVFTAILLLALTGLAAQAINKKDADIVSERNYFATTLLSIGDGVIVVDNQGRVAMMNPVAESLTGWRLEKAKNRPVAEIFVIIDETTRMPVVNPVEKALSHGVIIGPENHTLLLDRAGSEHAIDDSGAPIRSAAGDIQGGVLVFREISARREAELAIRESEHRFRDMSENLPLLVWVHDAGGELEYVNQSYCAFFGVDQETMQGDQWQMLVHQEDNDYIEKFTQAVRERSPFHASVRVKNAADEWRVLESFGQPRFSNAGDFIGFVGASVDLTDRLNAARQMQQTQWRLQQALEAGRLGEWMIDPRADSVQFSLRCAQILGYDQPVTDWTYAHFLSHIHDDDRDRVDAAFKKAIEHCQDWSFEVRINRADGAERWIWVRGGMVVTDGAEPAEMSGVMQDITQRRLNEEGNRFLAKISKPLNTLVDYGSTLQSVARLAVPFLADWCVIDLADSSGKLVRAANSHANAAVSKLVHQLRLNYGDTGQSVPAKVFQSGQSHCINNLADEDLQQLAQDSRQLAILRDLQPLACLAVPMQLRGECLGVISFFCSDSGRRFTKANVRLAERIADRITMALENAKLYGTVREADERKNVFLAMLSHELRNPLGALSNGVEVLRSHLTDEESRWTLEMMDRQKRQLTRLLDDLLDVSRISRGKITLDKRIIQPVPILENAVASVRPGIEEKEQRLTTNLEADVIYVEADPVRLEQVVTNLLSNASKYTPEGGSIDFSGRRDGETLVLEIADSGIGIAEDQREQIFDLFTQLGTEEAPNTTGLGLGLHLVRELVAMHGGSVTVTSEGMGRGSVFAVRLPIVKTADAAQSESIGSQTAKRDDTKYRNNDARYTSNSKLAIVLVDDNQDALQGLEKLLTLQGHEVHLAFDGETALQLISEQTPDLVVLDIGLPDISGYEVASRLRSDVSDRGVHLVALTGYGQPRDVAKSMSVGFDDHLVKPLDLDELNSIISRLGDPAERPE